MNKLKCDQIGGGRRDGMGAPRRVWDRRTNQEAPPPDVGDFAFTRRDRHDGGVGVPGSARD